jgi:hypothetical protein
MEPSLATVKRVFALSRNCCAFTNCDTPIVEESGTVTGEICHIKARNSGGPRYDPAQTEKQRHAFENLILMCARHNKLIDSEPGRYSVDVLLEMKEAHERGGSTKLSPSDAGKAEALYRTITISAGGHVMIDSPGAVQADQVVIKTQKKSVHVLPPAESLASDISKRNFIKHLIDRYNEFASQQPGRAFGYGAVYTKIKERFGAKWDLIPLHRFEDLATFLQDRINGTMRGRVNRGKGIPNYSTYDEYRLKYERRPGDRGNTEETS